MNKDLLQIIKFTVPAVVAVLGWWTGYYFSSKRDKVNKRRELTIQHLINAYRILTDEISHRKQEPDRLRKLEQIITEIQLFGSVQQVEMARILAREVAAGNKFELDPLINSLRADLRKQLELKKIEGNVTWLRFGNNSDTQSN